jgi:hypothetical protein
VLRLLNRLLGGLLSSYKADREANKQVLDYLLLKEVS